MQEKIRLTQFARHGGCAAKIGPDTLSRVLGRLPKFSDPDLIVGFETSDDAAVYKITDDVAVIQTLDFFTPVVDDPYTFGQVAATNALSDVYAMGGEPKIALNIVCFPGDLDPDILGEILRGGADKVREAGAVLVGGHSIQDDVPKYGLSVAGIVHPDRVYKNFGCKKGDVLILTKQLGSGIVNTAVKAQMASAEAEQEVIRVMTTLNRKAKEAAEIMKLTAQDLYEFGVVDKVLKEPKGGAQKDIEIIAKDMKKEIITSTATLSEMDEKELVEARYKKFRNMGEYIVM